MPRTNAHKEPSDQLDWIVAQAELMRDVHQAELLRLQKEIGRLQSELASNRLTLQSAYLALRGVKGCDMPPHARERVRGALVATARDLGIKPHLEAA